MTWGHRQRLERLAPSLRQRMICTELCGGYMPGMGTPCAIRTLQHGSCSTTQLVRGGEARMELILGTTPSWSLLIIQVFLGIIFFAHGAQLVFGWLGGQGLRATIHYF